MQDTKIPSFYSQFSKTDELKKTILDSQPETFIEGLTGSAVSMVLAENLKETRMPFLFILEDKEEAASILEEWQQEGYAIIFVTEPLARALGGETMDEWRNVWLPSVVIIPSAKEDPSLGRDTLRTAVRRATGIDLLSHI